MPVISPPEPPVFFPSVSSSASCPEFDNFLRGRGWMSVKHDYMGTQWWTCPDAHGQFSTAEAVCYEFIRFINIGHT